MDDYGINVDACRGRQRRLLEMMSGANLDAVVVFRNEHVQWLSGPRFGWVYSPVCLVAADGRVTLVAPNKPPEVAAADDVLTYEAQWHSTLRNDQRVAAAEVLLPSLAGKSWARIGVEGSAVPLRMERLAAELVDIEPELFRLRRRKDLDELALIRKAIAGTERMYARAREIVRPGVSEIEVFNELQGVAVGEFGEMMTGTGNDYQCGSRGGPPRDARVARAGELYILDLGPAFRGYFADNARTIAVTEPSDEQMQAWTCVMKVFEHLENSVRPGTRCRQLFSEAQAILDQAPVGVFNHHLGHGIGLFPHETPHLNPHWDDGFEVGDVFTAEPGLYDERLRAGMRIENDYVVTETGVERLTDFSMEL